MLHQLRTENMARPTISEDDRWDMGVRLRQARQRRFRTIREAAKAMDINESTLKGYEIGTRAISRDNVKLFAQRLRVPLAWLEWGLGSMEGDEQMPRGTRFVPVWGHITAGGRIEPDQGHTSKMGTVELPFPLPGESGYGALRIVGDSMLPAYPNDTIIIINKTDGSLRPEMIGRMTMVCLYDGRRYFRQIKRGSKKGTYTLQCWGGADIEDVRIESAMDVLCGFPPSATVIRMDGGKTGPVPREPKSHLAWLKNYKEPKRDRR